jgi:hypothetical protein
MRLPNRSRFTALVVFAALIVAGTAMAQQPVQPTQTVPVAPKTPVPPRKAIKGVDADNHLIIVNKPGKVSLVLGTNESSQNGARSAGLAMYPLQGRADFQLVVVVDLRDSIATWMPAVVLSRMRSNLDHEAADLKPYYLKNGNKGNPRDNAHVIPDFGGTICPQLGWPETSDNLRAILYNVDGREIKRWDNLTDMNAMETDVRAAIQALIDQDQAHVLEAKKASRPMQPPSLHPPMLPAVTMPTTD